MAEANRRVRADGVDQSEAIEERERQRRHQRHLSQLQFNDDGQLSREFLESLIDTSKLQSETIEIMQNYLDRNWMLANLSEAQEWDQRYKLDVMQLKVLGRHPPKESSIQGPIRAFLFDDPQMNLNALTPAERSIIDSFFDTLKAIVSRGREGFEREQLNTMVRESRTDDGRDEGGGSGGRFRGLFSR